LPASGCVDASTFVRIAIDLSLPTTGFATKIGTLQSRLISSKNFIEDKAQAFKRNRDFSPVGTSVLSTLWRVQFILVVDT
jgi:hypothetical protein